MLITPKIPRTLFPFLIPNSIKIKNSIKVCDYNFLVLELSENIDKATLIIIFLAIIKTTLIGINQDDWDNDPLNRYLINNHAISNPKIYLSVSGGAFEQNQLLQWRFCEND